MNTKPQSAPTQPNNFTLGVDVGGTKIAAGLVDPQGKIVFQTRTPMPAHQDAKAGFAALEQAISAVFAAQPDARATLTGIGICAPGPLDPFRGVILNPPNLPCWHNFPLANEVQRAFNVCAKIDNDANAAALAEAIWGAGIGFKNVLYATLGTGIGTGIIFDGHIYHGRTGSAAEGGHVTIDYNGPRCACGKRGCIEALASGPAIAKRAIEQLAASHQPSRLREIAAANPANLTAEHVAQAFTEGDPLARTVLEATSDLLTVWIGNLIDLLEPHAIVFGGGIAQCISEFFPRIQSALPNWCINARCCEIPLRLAKYGADAGIAGAAALCRADTKKPPTETLSHGSHT
jgi:glucokinase